MAVRDQNVWWCCKHIAVSASGERSCYQVSTVLIVIVHNWVICQVYCSQTIKLSVSSIAEVATDPGQTGSNPDLTVFFFFQIKIGFESSFIRRSGYEFGFAPPNNLGTNSALHFAETFFFWSPPEYWQKMPQFSVNTFFIFLVFT